MYLDTAGHSDPLRRRLRRLTLHERIGEARAFLRLFWRETEPPGALAARERAVVRDLKRHGFYRHTPGELAFGARVAWRNHARCIGRLGWKALEVRDLRDVRDPDAIAVECTAHMRAARADRGIRPMISIFAPVEGARLAPAIENEQVLQYAGYLRPGAPVLGDPKNVEITRIATSLGWRPPAEPGPFDLLPLIVRDEAGRRHCHILPADAVEQVAIAHPDHPALAALGLRWYTTPCVADMILTIGGIDYPCAPFNGYYMVTEIASRNLVDPFRYDLLAPAARAFGLGERDPLWRDKALTLLNEAVLLSFEAAGATLADHHQLSRQYLSFARREHAAGRIPSADWAWIVPPQAGAACPVFHLPMQDLADVPNYYRSRATDGGALRPSSATQARSRLGRRAERWSRRFHDWLRRRA